jgi:hypothetical protein
MALEGLKEKLKESWADLSSKVQENSAFNNLREKFEGQTPTVQRAVIYGSVAAIAIFLLSIPWSYINSSNDALESFNENRTLIEGLLHASRAAKEPSPLPPVTSADALKGRIETLLRENRLVPEQLGEMQPLPNRPAKDLAPAVVDQAGLAVQLKKLNVEQIVAISQQLQGLGQGIKLIGLDVNQTAGQTHYYDMVARVVSFGLPPVVIESDPSEKPGKKSNRRAPVRKSEEEGGE